MRMNITLLKLYPIYITLEMCGGLIENKCILLHTDNIAVMYILNNFTSRDKQIMTLVRLLVSTCTKYNILIQAKHVKGVDNKIPDMISCQQVQKALELAPYPQNNPDQVPENHLLQKLLKI